MSTGSLQAQLNQIQQRLSRLEAQAGGGEQLTPNYLTLTNGLVGADFTGLINALGLILPAGTGSSPAAIDRIKWVRSDGGVVADLTAFDQGGSGAGSALTLNQYDLGENALNEIVLTAGEGGSTYASLTLQADTGTGVEAIQAGVSAGPTVKIIDSLGDSSFVQSPSLGGRLAIQAAVGSNGSISSGIWTNIAAAWPTPFTSIATATYGLIQGANGGTFHFMASITNAGASVNVYNDGNPPIGYEVFFIGFGQF